MFCSGNNHVAGVGDEEAVDVLIDARLYDAVAQRRLHAGHDHRLIPVEPWQELEHVPEGLDPLDHIEPILEKDDLVQLVQILIFLVDHQRPQGLVRSEIYLVRRQTPYPADRRLYRERGQRGKAGQNPLPDQAGEYVGQRIAEQVRQRLGIEGFPGAVHSDFVGVVRPVEEDGQDQIAEENGGAHSLRVLRFQRRRVHGQPRRRHHRRHQDKMEQVQNPHSEGLRHFL